MTEDKGWNERGKPCISGVLYTFEKSIVESLLCYGSGGSASFQNTNSVRAQLQLMVDFSVRSTGLKTTIFHVWGLVGLRWASIESTVRHPAAPWEVLD
jgi:hypothetical protein